MLSLFSLIDSFGSSCKSRCKRRRALRNCIGKYTSLIPYMDVYVINSEIMSCRKPYTHSTITCENILSIMANVNDTDYGVCTKTEVPWYLPIAFYIPFHGIYYSDNSKTEVIQHFYYRKCKMDNRLYTPPNHNIMRTWLEYFESFW
jgi:hypothetical protein